MDGGRHSFTDLAAKRSFSINILSQRRALVAIVLLLTSAITTANKKDRCG